MSRYQRENVVQGKSQTPEGRLWSLENSRPLEGKKMNDQESKTQFYKWKGMLLRVQEQVTSDRDCQLGLYSELVHGSLSFLSVMGAMYLPTSFSGIFWCMEEEDQQVWWLDSSCWAWREHIQYVGRIWSFFLIIRDQRVGMKWKVEGTDSNHSFKKAVLKGRREIRC